MSTDQTVQQGGEDRGRSREKSLQGGRPPTQVPGYDLDRFLGVGAYGEVWVGVERNTGRRVAVKFYAHRGGLDWSLLSREVEKLAFLFADRYVVQLIGVGWDADPPYYIMEYLERGSLADLLREGTLPVGRAVELFRDVAVGLVHAHGKGVLHCDLKPANILLDQDGKPRLADFGQSRLSHEQAPALGTLFYMAPEQANLSAVPDARWDVYALGALVYCVLTGNPPHRTERGVEELDQTAELDKRLALYQRAVRRSPPPSEHRKVPGVDRALAEIIDRCLAADPAKRYPNVQAVLAALDARAARRARRPMMILGVVGPLLLLAVVAAFAWQGFATYLHKSEADLTARALDNNRLMALDVSGLASKELELRYHAVGQVASSNALRRALAAMDGDPELAKLSRELSDPGQSEESLKILREKFRNNEKRKAFQAEFDTVIPEWMRPASKEGREKPDEVASWFICNADGISTTRVPQSETLGKNFAWRSFFFGGDCDRERTWRPQAKQRLAETKLSAVFRSQATGAWTVAVAAPLLDPDSGSFLGVVALTVRVNRFVELKGDEDQFPVLVELRPGDNQGMVLQHPLFDALAADRQPLPDRVQTYRLGVEELPTASNAARMEDYRDPLAADPEGSQYRRHWLARIEPVKIHDQDAGWGVIVQESYDTAIGATLASLRAGLIGYGLAALAMVLVVLWAVWILAIRLLKESTPLRGPAALGNGTESMSTTKSATRSDSPNSPSPSGRGPG